MSGTLCCQVSQHETRLDNFVHNNFPAQFKFLAPALSNEGYNVHVISLREFQYKNITSHKYEITTGTTKNIHKYAIEFEAKMIRAQSVGLKCLQLKEKGLKPDLIIAHPCRSSQHVGGG